MPEQPNPDVFRALVEQASDAIIFADRDGSIRIWNRGAERVFGYPAAEAIGASLDLIVPERFRRAHWEGFRRAIETGSTRYVDRVLTTRALHKDGGKRYVDMSFGLVKDAAGAVLGALAVARDCTERHVADAELRQRIAVLDGRDKAGHAPG